MDPSETHLVNRLRKLAEDVTGIEPDYCARYGIGYPDPCEDPFLDHTPFDPFNYLVAFGPFRLPVSPELAIALQESPNVGPSITPDPVPESTNVGPSITPDPVPESPANPGVPIHEESIWGRLVQYSSGIGNAVVPDRFPKVQAAVALLIPGGLLLLLAIWILKKTRR